MKGFLHRNAGACSFSLVLFVTFVLEIALVERKYNLFKGGYLQSKTLELPGDILTFFLTALFCQIFALGLFYWLVTRLHPSDKRYILARYNFVFFAITGLSLYLVAKYQVLSYFSDAISFRLIKQLGGGSLVDALIYVMDEAVLIIISSASLILFYWLGIKFIARKLDNSTDITRKSYSRAQVGLFAALALIIAPALLYAVNDLRTVRYGLDRITSFQIINKALSEVTDFDRDGYSYYSNLVDIYPFDSSRYPLALDIPSNGIDEDGLSGDFEYVKALQSPRIADPKSGKNLVLIVLESTRADALGREVDGVPVTPNLNALAQSGTSVKNAYSHVGFTGPSLKSLFSSTFYASEKTPSLFRELKKSGYKIAVFSGQPETFAGISEAVGMQESSDVFLDADVLKEERAFSFTAKGSLLVDGKILLREFDRTMGQVAEWDRPVFTYINFQSAHFPYFHPGAKRILTDKPIPRSSISKKNEAWVRKTYWNAVAYGDWLVGQVIARLKKIGVYDNSIVIVTADHGESLFDDGFLGHGHILNAQQTRIPLIINIPDVKVREPIGLTDFYGLIRDLLDGADMNRPSSGAEVKGSVFQFIGSLEKPRSIGLIEADGLWTVLDLETRVVDFKDQNRLMDYDQLAEFPELKERTDRLIFEWERHRWERHLAGSHSVFQN